MRQSVGSTPCLLGKAVDCSYLRGPDYLEVSPFISNIVPIQLLLVNNEHGSVEFRWNKKKTVFFFFSSCTYYKPTTDAFLILQVDVDIGSSAVANGVLGLVFGVVTTLVVDMAFLIQVQSLFRPVSSTIQFQ